MRIYLVIAVSAALAAAGCGGGDSARKGEEALARGDFRSAARHFSDATRRNPSSVPLLYNLGAALALDGDTRGAIDSFRDVLRFSPGDINASEYLAAELAELGTQEALMEAHALLEFALQYRTEPDERARALNSLALVENAMHRTDLATARLVAAADAAPDYAPPHYNFAKICARDDRLAAAAMREADIAAKLSPDPAIRDAAAQISSAASAKLPPPYAHTTSQSAADLMKEAAAAAARRDSDKAAGLYIKAANADPNSLEAAMGAANAMVAATRYSEATPFFDRAAALDPANFDIAITGARLDYSTGNFRRAIDRLVGSVIPSWPDNPQPFFLASYAFAQEQRYFEARVFGEIYIAKSLAQTPSADISAFKGWIATLPDTKFKP